MDVKNILQGMKSGLEQIDNARKKLLKDLTPDQRIAYSKFENDLILLTKNGDHIGVEKLKEKFKEVLDGNS